MKPPFDKYELEKRPKTIAQKMADGERVDDITKYFLFLAIPTILFILVLIYKDEIDWFFGTLVGHALISFFLGSATVAGFIWGARRVWYNLIKK